MRDHMDQPMRIDELAGHLNHSASYLYYLFKQNTGYSPINYFNHLKIQETCKYLRELLIKSPQNGIMTTLNAWGTNNGSDQFFRSRI
jgi:YesN/AraC family two-component response regulator